MNEALDRLLGRSNRPDSARADRAGEIADLVHTTLGLDQQAADAAPGGFRGDRENPELQLARPGDLREGIAGAHRG